MQENDLLFLEGTEIACGLLEAITTPPARLAYLTIDNINCLSGGLVGKIWPQFRAQASEREREHYHRRLAFRVGDLSISQFANTQ